MNILESINSTIEKQLSESLQLSAGIPYMMRHDGEVLGISFSKDGLRDHPYVVDRVRRNSAQFLSDTLRDRLPCLKWFYKNTQSDALREDIQAFYQCLIKSNFEDLLGTELEGQISKEFDLPAQHEASGLSYSLEDARTELDIIEQSTNQEFLRFRLQRSSQGYEIFCRISSKDFNWYDAICKFVTDNYIQIGHIIISYDQQAGRGANTLTYRNQSLSFVEVEDFLTLRGTPMLEQLHKVMGDLTGVNLNESLQIREGVLLHDSCAYCNPNSINKLVEKLTQLTEDYQK